MLINLRSDEQHFGLVVPLVRDEDLSRSRHSLFLVRLANDLENVETLQLLQARAQHLNAQPVKPLHYILMFELRKQT